MATGTLPFRGESSGVIFKAILDGTPTPAMRLNPDVPSKLDEIVNKCLEKDRNLRYQHASEIRTDLQRLKCDTESGRQVASAAAVVTTAMQSTAQPSQRFTAGWVLRSLEPNRRVESTSHRGYLMHITFRTNRCSAKRGLGFDRIVHLACLGTVS
jgi:serine/threonine protein kinase